MSFTHLAGGPGGAGFADGSGAAASFNSPAGQARDASGNVYIADTGNHAIRKMTPGGVVTTLAGTGRGGFADGTGTAASFFSPRGVAVDGNGNVYVADTNNHRIRKVTPAGVVTTLAGSGTAGSAEGAGTAASFYGPYGVAVEGSGVVYVADTSNNKIRRVTPAGSVSTLAGSGARGSADGQGTAATFNVPIGLAVDTAGNLYLGDNGNLKVRKVTPSGVVSTLAGSGSRGSADGPGTVATFNGPIGLAVDGAGGVTVADYVNHKIRKVSATGVVTTLAGTGTRGSLDGTGAVATFSNPVGVSVDGSGNVFVSDDGNVKIRKVAADGSVSTVAGYSNMGNVDGTGTAASFWSVTGVAVDAAGNAYVTDGTDQKVRKISPSGAVTTLAGSGAVGNADGPGPTASFENPIGVAVDAAGNVFVADSGNNRIRQISPSGMVSTLAGSGNHGGADGPAATASFSVPGGVCVDGAGTVYVAEITGNRIRKIAGGMVSTFAGSGAVGSADGAGTAASFGNPSSVALDPAGNLLVADQGGNRIRRITPGGVVTTLAGSGTEGNADGTGTAASFRRPYGVAVDGAGNTYVADASNHQIRKVTPAGVVTTLGGSGAIGSADGTGAAATFAFPTGIAVSGTGQVWVADTLNATVRLGRNLGSAGCAPDDKTLCLLGGRFRMSADYADYGGGHGQGKAVYLTPDTGTFWFFSAANVEAVAKMVSFCGGGSNNVALYAGGLTDLGVTLHVTDTRNGTTKDYTNPLGTGFGLIRDGPFGCPAAVSGGGEANPDTGASPGDGIVETTMWRDPEVSGTAVCTPGATALCLLGGRFRVSATYRDYAGNMGMGQAVALTSDTGHFWFFDAKNVEVMAKMVSFCGSGSNNVGVYAGGLTDIAVTLTVTDVRTGLEKTYTNQLGAPFQLIRDGPFTCP